MNRPIRRSALAAGLLASTSICACSGSVAPAGPRPAVCSDPRSSSSGAQALASADTAFALALFPAVADPSGAPATNVVMSPYSVSAALTMVDVGARGETDSQIEQVLHLPASGSQEASAYAALQCSLEADGSSNGNTLSIANSLWGQRGTAFEAAFLTTLNAGYGAPLQQVDFASDPNGAADTIDEWVSTETKGNIPMLLGPADVTPMTRLVLVNAVYFQGVWENGFDPGETSPASFTLASGTSIQVPTMSGTIQVSVASTPAFEVVELPYQGGAMAMDILLPPEPSGLASLEASLTPATLGAALGKLAGSSWYIIDLPKFSFDVHVELVSALSSMGMTDVFDPMKADLSGMDGMTDLSVSAVVQEARVEVNEQGTVAAAGTGVVTCSDCATISEPPEIDVDHPFVFLIRDMASGSILFVGHVVDPTQP